VHILKAWGVKEIVFDVIFSEPSTAFDDGSLGQAIKEAGNVYLPVTLESLGGKMAWIHAMPEFERSVKGVGHVNIFPDQDGTIRRVPPLLSYGGETYPYLGAKVAFDYLGKDILKDRLNVPTDQKGRIFINWVGSWKDSFQHYSFLDVIKSYAAIREGRTPLITPDKIKGKICVIGLTAPGLTDIKANPMEGTYPAVGVQTNIMNSILTGQFAWPAAPRWNTISLLVIGLLLSFSFLFSKQVLSPAVGLGFGLFWVLFAFWLFVDRGVWVYVINPLLLIISLFVFSAVFSITIGKREQERLFALATRDGLTGLYVIRHFRNLLNDAVAKAHTKRQSLSIILLDLDFFKNINDEHGHVAGDVALRYVAENIRLMTQTEIGSGEMNAVGRYGGEEFIVMLKKCHLIDAAFNYAEKIRQQFERNSFSYEGVKIPLTVSLGVAALRSGETVPDMMVLRADEALYRAKTEGRNRVCVEKNIGEDQTLPQ
jgi:diguanylate cyclase (GGDEF)-like protein